MLVIVMMDGRGVLLEVTNRRLQCLPLVVLGWLRSRRHESEVFGSTIVFQFSITYDFF